MKWNDMAATVALAAGALTACAEQPAKARATPPAQTQAKVDSESNRAYTLADYPELTPEEVGHRVLKLIDSFKSKEDWNIEHIRKASGLPMKPVKGWEGSIYALVMDVPDTGWYYGVYFSTNPQGNAKYTDVTLRFINQVGEQYFYNADMAPVCGMDFEAYDTALRNMGFVPEPQYGEYGRLLGIDYTDPHRMSVWLRMMIRPERYGYGDDAEHNRVCVDTLVIDKPW